MCCGSGGGGYPVTTAKYEGHTAASFQYSLSSFGSLIQRHASSDTALLSAVLLNNENITLNREIA